MNAGFTDTDIREFRGRIRVFMETGTGADPASAIFNKRGESLAVDGLFHHDLMLFAVQAPGNFKEQMRIVAVNGYQGATVTLQYSIPKTLPLRFKAICALTSTTPKFRGWLVLDLIRVPPTIR